MSASMVLTRFLPLCVALLFTLNIAVAATPPADALLPNSNFEMDANGDQWPDGWARPKSGGNWQEESGNHFLRLTSTAPGEMIILYQQIKIPPTVKAIGMQTLLDAARSTGARNIVLVGGLDYAYDLSGIMKGFALEDKNGNGIIYSTHIYPWKKGWQEKVMTTAEKHPILVGEVGANTQKMSWLPSEVQEDAATWVPEMLGFIQKYKFHWTGFSFHPKAGPTMLTGWDYAPTPEWGAFAKRALAGEPFELKKMR